MVPRERAKRTTFEKNMEGLARKEGGKMVLLKKERKGGKEGNRTARKTRATSKKNKSNKFSFKYDYCFLIGISPPFNLYP
jgi:hypothetical protein